MMTDSQKLAIIRQILSQPPEKNYSTDIGKHTISHAQKAKWEQRIAACQIAIGIIDGRLSEEDLKCMELTPPS